jgi:ATP-dependent Zn protease
MQAAILTGRRSKPAITNQEIDDSVDRIVAGMEGTPMLDGKSKSLVAYHEVGHAICGTLTPGKLILVLLISSSPVGGSSFPWMSCPAEH